jgi:superoxide dismutase
MIGIREDVANHSVWVGVQFPDSRQSNRNSPDRVQSMLETRFGPFAKVESEIIEAESTLRSFAASG